MRAAFGVASDFGNKNGQIIVNQSGFEVGMLREAPKTLAGRVCTRLHWAEAIVSDPKDREEEKVHIKQALHWNGLTELVAGGGRHASTWPTSRRRGGRESPDPAPDQAGLRARTETNTFEPIDLDKTKKRYPVVIPCMKGVSEQVRRVM